MTDLLRAALLLLEDACPPDPAAYLCAVEDADDGSACERCWRRYLFAVANGKIAPMVNHRTRTLPQSSHHTHRR